MSGSHECLAKLMADGMTQEKGKIQRRIKVYQGEIYVFAYASQFLCVPHENERQETYYSKGRCTMSKSCFSCILYTAAKQNAEEAIVLRTVAAWCIHTPPKLLIL
jgi:hypothetical protein